jgi:hypothetical protein
MNTEKELDYKSREIGERLHKKDRKTMKVDPDKTKD